MQKPHGPPDVFPGGKNKELPGLNRMLIEDFVDIFSVWEEAQPYLSLMVDEQVKPLVGFDPGKCWGCGLCANTCVPGAIEMVSRNSEAVRKNDDLNLMMSDE